MRVELPRFQVFLMTIATQLVTVRCLTSFGEQFAKLPQNPSNDQRNVERDEVFAVNN